MKLNHYWTSGGTFEFDPDSGEVTRIRGDEESPTNWGSVWKQRGRWFALWHDGDALVFQHGQHRWNLTPDVTLRVTGRNRRTFRVLRNGDEAFRFTYFAKWAIFSFVDPTYDALDAESDDFFLYVTAMWKHWKDRRADEFTALLQEAGSRTL
ncbi:MAG: hypothetical protein QNJ19_06305 [Woeseiaceae bacterium]|nr:hypothetical protein [Woeseiaceae bacterium]